MKECDQGGNGDMTASKLSSKQDIGSMPTTLRCPSNSACKPWKVQFGPLPKDLTELWAPALRGSTIQMPSKMLCAGDDPCMIRRDTIRQSRFATATLHISIRGKMEEKKLFKLRSTDIDQRMSKKETPSRIDYTVTVHACMLRTSKWVISS